MAGQTITPSLVDFGQALRLQNHSPRIVIINDLTPTDNPIRLFGTLDLNGETGLVSLWFASSQDESFTNTGDDLSDQFEVSGTITITVSNLSLTIPIGNDAAEPYNWTPNATEVINFVSSVKALHPQPSATDFRIILDDGASGISVRQSGSKRDISAIYVRDSGTLRTIKKAYVRVGGVLRQIFSIFLHTLTNQTIAAPFSGGNAYNEAIPSFQYIDRRGEQITCMIRHRTTNEPRVTIQMTGTRFPPNSDMVFKSIIFTYANGTIRTLARSGATNSFTSGSNRRIWSFNEVPLTAGSDVTVDIE